MKDRANIELAKSRLPMTALLDQLAPDWKKKNPIRTDDSNNSFSVRLENDGWRDHGPGGQRGDQIDFLERFKGLNTADATRLFLEMAGVETAHKNGHAPKPKTVSVNWPASVAAFTDEKAQELAEWRGFSMPFVQWLKARDLVGIYRDDRGNDQFALPLHDDNGKVVGIHHKHTDGKWRTLGSTRPLVIGDKTAAKWLMFESQWDAGAVMEALEYHLEGYEPSYAILVTRGAENGKFASIIPADSEAIVIMQNDEEKNGRIASDDWLEEIKQHCPARLKVARPPAEVKDCNDWLKRGDADFNGMIAKAETVAKESPCLDWIDFNAEQEALPDAPEIVRGMIRRGEKASLGGSSKSKKTFTGLDLVLSVASGKPWMGIETTKVPVVIVDMELRKKTLQLRIKKILEVKGITLQRGDLHIIALRGKVTTAEKALAHVKANCPQNVGLFFIDPFYKLNAGRDENSAGDITTVMNLIDNLGAAFDAAILYSAHYSKGNQAGKEAIDRISGSGVYGRDADTIISMTAHKEPECFTMEPIFRSFAPMVPWVVRWNYPLMERADDLDPAQLKKAPGMFEAQFSLDQLSDIIAGKTMSSSEIERQCWDKYEMSDSTVKRLLKAALNQGKVEKLKVGLWKGVTA
jgi:hypothetical protein